MITIIIIWLVVLTLGFVYLFIAACNNRKAFNEWVDGTAQAMNKNTDTSIDNNKFFLKKFIWIEKVMAHKNPRHSDPEYKPLEGLNATENNKH